MDDDVITGHSDRIFFYHGLAGIAKLIELRVRNEQATEADRTILDSEAIGDKQLDWIETSCRGFNTHTWKRKTTTEINLYDS